MKPIHAIVVVVLSHAALLGCASSKPEAEKERVFLTDTSKYTWTGRTVDEVVRVFGRPSSRAPDGTGMTVLTYDEIKAVGNTPTKPGVSVDANDADDQGYDGTPSTQTPAERTVASKTQAQFWIDSEGKVTRFYFSPEMYRKGVPSPPSSGS
jgi:hypothetical protein